MTHRSEQAVAFSLLLALIGLLLVAALTADPIASAGGGLPAGIAPLLNVLLLGAAACVAGWVLVRHIGDWAPLQIAVFVFVSVLGVAVFSNALDILFAAATAFGLAILFKNRAPSESRVKEVYDLDLYEPVAQKGLRWAAIGLLLSVPVAANPVHLLLLVAVLFALPEASPQHERRKLGLALLGGALIGVLVGWFVVTAFPSTNPNLDLAFDATWEPELPEVLSQPKFLLHGLISLFVGRSIGVLVMFFPIVWSLFAFERHSRLRSNLLMAALLILCLPLVYRPFDFWAGASAPHSANGQLINHVLVPIYPVFWFLGTRLVRPLHALTVTLIGLFLMGQAWAGAWLQPAAPSVARHLGAVFESPFVQKSRGLLPLETAQRALLRSGLADQQDGQFRIRRLDVATSADSESHTASVLGVESGRPATFLLASQESIDLMVLSVTGGAAPGSIGLAGGEVLQLMLEPRGGVRFEIDLEEAVAHHWVWWSKEPVYFFELRVLLPRGDDNAAGRYTVGFVPGSLLGDS